MRILFLSVFMSLESLAQSPIRWVGDKVDLKHDTFVATGSLIKNSSISTHGYKLTFQTERNAQGDVTCVSGSSIHLDHLLDLRTTGPIGVQEFISIWEGKPTLGFSKRCKDPMRNSFLAFAAILLERGWLADCQK